MSGYFGFLSPVLPDRLEWISHWGAKELPDRGIEWLRNTEAVDKIGRAKIRLLPKLCLRRVDEEFRQIHASILVVTEGKVEEEGLRIHLKEGKKKRSFAPYSIKKVDGCEAWCYEIPLRLLKNAHKISYQFNGQKYPVMVPGRETVEAAVFSCNGRQNIDEQVEEEKACVMERNWARVVESHKKTPIELAFFIGDQIYNDDMEKNLPFLRKFCSLSLEEKYEMEFTEEMAQELRVYLFRKYCRHFSREHFRTILSQVLTVMSWDDHDIIDGWGDRGWKLQNCPVFQGIYDISKEMFEVFQQNSSPEVQKWMKGDNIDPYFGGGFSSHFVLGKSTFISLDIRSERKPDDGKQGAQILSRETLDDLKEVLENVPKDCEQVYVLEGVPFSYPYLKEADQFFDIQGKMKEWADQELPDLLKKTQKTEVDLKDDLRDKWCDPSHREERKELCSLLLNFAEETGKQVIVCSGDIHAAENSILVRKKDVKLLEEGKNPKAIVYLMTSSSLVNVPIPKIMKYGLRLYSNWDNAKGGMDVGDGNVILHTNWVRKEDGEEKMYLRRNNFLRIQRNVQGVVRGVLTTIPRISTGEKGWVSSAFGALSQISERIYYSCWLKQSWNERMKFKAACHHYVETLS